MTRLLRFASLLLLVGVADAWANGTITHLSGSVMVERADGTAVPATTGTKVLAGDTIVTAAGAYARMEMTDRGEIVLRPGTRIKIESYAFNEAKPQEDSFVFSMLKGGLRTVTGLIGKRGNRDAYELKTPTATIGIRGTDYTGRVCAGSECGALPPGTYLHVANGSIFTSNGSGGLLLGSGQSAHVPQFTPPVLLPRDPGIGFTPPPTVPRPGGGAAPPGGGQGGAGPGGPPGAPGGGPSAEGGADCTIE